MVKVSVLMPVYNTNENFLEEAIESILNQTFQDFELIILDDGSEKDIIHTINRFKSTKIKFYKNDKNYGVAYSRNKLISLAEGEYIAFQDSDDISMPQRLEKEVCFLNNNPNISIVGSWIERFPHNKISKQLPNPKILDFLSGCSLYQGSTMIRIKDLIKFNLNYNEKFITSEDYDLWCRVICYLEVANIQEVLLKYRRNKDSLVNTKGKLATKLDKEIKNNLLKKISNDKILQEKVIKTISKHAEKKLSLKENIFSIRNEWEGIKKFKKICILGIQIKLSTTKEK